MMARLIAGVLFLFCYACDSRNSQEPVFHSGQNPSLLSEWGMLHVKKDVLSLGDRVTPYDLATPLFSDYAQKLRTIWMPNDKRVVFRENEIFDLPVGTVITKTFYYEQSTSEWDGSVLSYLSLIHI